MADLLRELRAIGWSLTEEGLALCVEACAENKWSQNCRNIEKAALNLDLRSIGAPGVSSDVARNLEHSLEGQPLVLQLQKVKNVAVPSTKQLLPSPSKRLLRLQLTDGHTTLSAVETEGPQRGLSPLTPPGTKVRLSGSVTVQNGFILLRQTTKLEILGGEVEHLIKKWNLQKAIPDNIDRSKASDTSGPPPFATFKETSGARTQMKKDNVTVPPSQPPTAQPSHSTTGSSSSSSSSGRGDKTDSKSVTRRPPQQVYQPSAGKQESFRSQPKQTQSSSQYPLSAAPQKHRERDEFQSPNWAQSHPRSTEGRPTRGRGREDRSDAATSRHPTHSGRGRGGGRRQTRDDHDNDDQERSNFRASHSRHSRRDTDDVKQAPSSGGVQLADFFEQKLRITSAPKHEPASYDEYQGIDEDLAMELSLQASASLCQDIEQRHHEQWPSSTQYHHYKTDRRYEADFSPPALGKERRTRNEKPPPSGQSKHEKKTLKQDVPYQNPTKKTSSKPFITDHSAKQERSLAEVEGESKKVSESVGGHNWDWLTSSSGGAPMGATKHQQ